MVLLHKHIMPMNVAIFKPLPQFHQLVGLVPTSPERADKSAVIDINLSLEARQQAG
jgi:hypothetical protein